MVRRIGVVTAVGVVAAVAWSPVAFAADPTVSFASGSSWVVTDEDGSIGPSLSLPGPAQDVCLNSSAPSPCPAGAVEYGWAGGGWTADLSSIPGATWVWAPGIDQASTPADNDTYRFTKVVNVPGTPIAGSVSVAADDGATVYVNGNPAGGTTTPAQLTTLDVSALLVAGDNAIAIVAANGQICGTDCTYQDNPGGVVFGGQISYQAASPSQAPGSTTRPRVSTPPTSTADLAPAEPSDHGLPWVLLGTAAAATAALGVSRRSARRHR